MYAASREASVRSWAALRAALGGSNGVAAWVGRELFGVVEVLDRERSLRIALADVAVSGSRRAELSERVFGTQVSAATDSVLSTAVAQNWSRAADLVDTLALLGQTALLESAAEVGRLDAVEDELFRFGRILADNPHLEQTLADQRTPAAGKRDLVERLLAGKAESVTVQLAQQAVIRRRGPLVTAFEDLTALAADRRSQLVAYVHAASALSDYQRERLARGLARIYRKPVTVHVDIDPALLSGLVVRIGDDVIDGSALGQLERLRRSLT